MAAAYEVKIRQMSEEAMPDHDSKNNLIENIDFLNHETEHAQRYKEG
jgi:hypothetical protein